MKKNKILMFCSIWAFLMSCSESNEIYWNEQRHTISSRSKVGIRSLDIENDSVPHNFTIRWKGDRLKAPLEVDLKALQSQYEVIEGANIITSNKVELKPNTKYVISRMQGDRGPFNLEVITDALGNIKGEIHK